MISKYIIGEILDKETNKRSEKFACKVGRECYINEDYVRENAPVLVQYEDGRGFYTSNVISIEQTDYGVWIETLNSFYRFDNK